MTVERMLMEIIHGSWEWWIEILLELDLSGDPITKSTIINNSLLRQSNK